MIISNAKKRKINFLAYKIRNVLDLDFPTNLETAIKRLDGTLKYVSKIPEDDFSRVIKTGEETFEIEVVKNLSLEKQRFSIAYELGNLFINMGFLIEEEKWQTFPINLVNYKKRILQVDG